MAIISDRINRLARLNKAKRYLEIGVAEGHTFHKVEIADKTAVDPEFLFDLAAYENLPGHHYFNIPSDDYFLQMAGELESVYGSKDWKWDIIFIDGLHVYEQAMRDFENSLNFAHRNTIWIFDDTVPSDPWAAIPDMRKCYFFRQLAGVSGLAWQGDVYKCVFAIHDFFPEFSYATVADAGNPQTVVWRTEKPARRRGIFKKPEDVANLGYFGMLEKCAALNPMTDEAMSNFVGQVFERPQRDGASFLRGFVRPLRLL